MGAIPVCPARMLFQVVSTSRPQGEIAPIPVTTTLRMVFLAPLVTARCRHRKVPTRRAAWPSLPRSIDAVLLHTRAAERAPPEAEWQRLSLLKHREKNRPDHAARRQSPGDALRRAGAP